MLLGTIHLYIILFIHSDSIILFLLPRSFREACLRKRDFALLYFIRFTDPDKSRRRRRRRLVIDVYTNNITIHHHVNMRTTKVLLLLLPL